MAKLKSKFKAAGRVYRDGGLQHLARVTVRSILKKAGIRKQIHILVKDQDVIAADWINTPYLTPKLKVKPPFRINWVVSPPGSGGGHQNIFRFIKYLSDRGHNCRVYFYQSRRHQDLSDIRKTLKKHYPPLKVDLGMLNGEMQPADAIFATGWETAYPVFNSKIRAKKFYFVQDFEPLFYPISSESVLAENTYRFGFHGITAGKWLEKKLSSEYGMPCDHYDFGSDFTRYSFDNKNQRKKIMFYARPVTPRRGFELGVLALEFFAKQHPDYEIHTAGWNIGEYRLPFKFIDHGVMSLKELNSFYNEMAACLVLSLTNMSLLPLELLAAGVIPVVNDGENNRLVSDNPYIKYARPTPRAMADALSEIVSKKDLPDYAGKASRSVRNLDWEVACRQLEDILKRELNG